jgi:hypothetical protein
LRLALGSYHHPLLSLPGDEAKFLAHCRTGQHQSTVTQWKIGPDVKLQGYIKPVGVSPIVFQEDSQHSRTQTLQLNS